jgi:hypothetical protein
MLDVKVNLSREDDEDDLSLIRGAVSQGIDLNKGLP